MIPLFKVWASVDDAVYRYRKVLESGYTGQGPVVEEFEAALANLYRVDPALVVTVNSGTSAIELALRVLGVKAGSRVCATPLTCAADWHTILNIGAEIVFGDCDPRTGLMTRPVEAYAYLYTDLSGLSATPCDGVVVQDAAQNFTGRMYGDATCLSFQSIKHLSTGDGGCIIFRDKAKADEARLRRWFGLDRKSSADFRSQQNIRLNGYKMHMTDLAASLGLANLPGAVRNVAKSRENARWYQERLPEGVLIPWQEEATYWTYMILVEDRASFMAKMTDAGIHVSPVQSIGTKHDLFPKASLPGAEWYGARNVAIPNGWWVTERQREYVLEQAMRAL